MHSLACTVQNLGARFASIEQQEKLAEQEHNKRLEKKEEIFQTLNGILKSAESSTVRDH